MEILLDDGNVRRLGMTQPTEDNHKMRAGRKRFIDVLKATGNNLIPRSQWKTIDRSHIFDVSWLLDQIHSNGCTGGSGVAMLMRELFTRYGVKFILSGAYLYAHINDGQDNGSNIIDAMVALEQYGTCLASEFNFPKIFMSQIPASANQTAQRFKLAEAYTINTFDELGTALQMGFFPHFDTRVGSNWEQYDAQGCVQFSSGQTNHAIGADGMEIMPNGEPIILGVNDWGLWGQKHDGRMRMHEKSFGSGGTSNSAYVMVAADPDPLSPQPPAPAP